MIMLATGLLMGVMAAISLDDDAWVGQLVGAAAVTLPAIGIVLGVAVVVMGVAPRAFGLVWAYVTYVGVVGCSPRCCPTVGPLRGGRGHAPHASRRLRLRHTLLRHG